MVTALPKRAPNDRRVKSKTLLTARACHASKVRLSEKMQSSTITLSWQTRDNCNPLDNGVGNHAHYNLR